MDYWYWQRMAYLCKLSMAPSTPCLQVVARALDPMSHCTGSQGRHSFPEHQSCFHFQLQGKTPVLEIGKRLQRVFKSGGINRPVQPHLPGIFTPAGTRHNQTHPSPTTSFHQGSITTFPWARNMSLINSVGTKPDMTITIKDIHAPGMPLIWILGFAHCCIGKWPWTRWIRSSCCMGGVSTSGCFAIGPPLT